MDNDNNSFQMVEHAKIMWSVFLDCYDDLKCKQPVWVAEFRHFKSACERTKRSEEDMLT